MNNTGFNSIRLNDSFNSREIAFAEQWAKVNSDSDNHKFFSRNLFDYLLEDNTERDQQVAATVIQWLGTNVGQAFLVDVIKKCPEMKKYLESCE